jgi:hypothetical protein
MEAERFPDVGIGAQVIATGTVLREPGGGEDDDWQTV